MHRERRATLLICAATAFVLVIVVAVFLWGRTQLLQDGSAMPAPMSSVGTGHAPWPVPADPLSGARAAGLKTSKTEGTATHLHAHLDVVVDGEPVPVPAGIGVDRSRRAFAELHTHDDSGLLHIEASTQRKNYILAQLFRVWQVRLDETGVGNLDDGNGKRLRAYVDGREVTENPAAIELEPRRQIALVYGPTDATVTPPTYSFAPGD